MEPYMHNRRCSCARCRARSLMGAAVVVTVGVLFLLSNFRIFLFHRSWPVLLLVIGMMLFLGQAASVDGHVSPYQRPGAFPANPPQPWGPNTTPPPPPGSSSGSGEHDS